MQLPRRITLNVPIVLSQVDDAVARGDDGSAGGQHSTRRSGYWRCTITF